MHHAEGVDEPLLLHQGADRKGKCPTVSIDPRGVDRPVEVRRRVPVPPHQQRHVEFELPHILEVPEQRGRLLDPGRSDVLGREQFRVGQLRLVPELVGDVGAVVEPDRPRDEGALRLVGHADPQTMPGIMKERRVDLHRGQDAEVRALRLVGMPAELLGDPATEGRTVASGQPAVDQRR